LRALVGEHVGGHLAREPGGRERVHADALARPLRRQLARQVHQPALGGRVRRLRHLAGADHAEHRCHVHDRAAAGGEHRPPEALAAQEGPGEIRRQHLRESLERLVLRRDHAGDARVVDQHVDASEALEHACHQAVDLGLAGDVGGVGDGLGAAGAQARGQLVDAVAAARHQHDACAGAGQALGQRRADARRSAGHHGDAAVHPEERRGIVHDATRPSDPARRRATQRR
jgi:hypothetical protein